MKKITFLLFILLFQNFSFANNYNLYCSNNTVQKTFSGNLMSLSGINTLTRNIIENEIKKILKNELNTNFKVKINNFYGVNILNGEFKNLTIKTNKLNYNNIVLSNVKLNTICPYNHISYNDNQLFFNEDLILKYSAKITKKDIEEISQSKAYRKIIDKMNNDKIISSLFKIEKSDIEIKNSDLLFSYTIKPSSQIDIFSLSKLINKPIKLTFKASLEIIDNQVKIVDFKLNSKSTYLKYILPALNMFNPTLWKIKIDKNNNGKIFVDTIKIIDSEILLDGHILINKNI